MKGIQEFLPASAVEVVVYHSPCNDGHAAAAQFYYLCDSNSISFIGIHPKDDLLTPENIKQLTGKHVVFVDVCFSPDTMTKVSGLVKKAIVLDHHITNQEATFPDDLENIKFHFEMGTPGCYMAWSYLTKSLYGETCTMPKAIEYIGLYDVYQHKKNPETVYFNVAFTRPASLHDWDRFLRSDEETEKVVAKGMLLYDYKQSVLDTMLEKAEWHGDFVIINGVYPWINELGEMLCEKNPERSVAVIWNKTASGPFSVSFRSHEELGPDVAKIAERYGGGGHPHAAAARLPEETPPWEVFCDDTTRASGARGVVWNGYADALLKMMQAAASTERQSARVKHIFDNAQDKEDLHQRLFNYLSIVSVGEHATFPIERKFRAWFIPRSEERILNSNDLVFNK